MTLNTLCSVRFAVLVGPINHIKHFVSKERLPFSFVYIGSLALTLYFSLGVRRSYDPYTCETDFDFRAYV